MNSYSNEKRIRGKKILVLAMSLMLIMVMIPASAFASGSASDLTGFGTCVQSITLSGPEPIIPERRLLRIATTGMWIIRLIHIT